MSTYERYRSAADSLYDQAMIELEAGDYGRLPKSSGAQRLRR